MVALSKYSVGISMSKPVEPGWDLIGRVEAPDGATYQAEAKQLPGADKMHQWRVWRFNPSHTVPQGAVVRQGQEKSRNESWEKARAALKEASGKR